MPLDINDLVDDCDTCIRNGNVDYYGGDRIVMHTAKDCPDCGGRGAVPSEFGRAILDFIKEYS